MFTEGASDAVRYATRSNEFSSFYSHLSSFAEAGLLVVDFFGFSDIAESVAVQVDGKIVVGGVAEDNFDGYGMIRILP